MFGNSQPLRAVNSSMAAKEIGHETSHREINRVVRAKKLDAHDRAGQRCVGGSRKNSDKAQSGKKVDGCSGDYSQRVSQRGADKKEGCYFSIYFY